MEIESERYHLRWAGVVGLLPLPAMIIGFAIGQFPWPDDNLGGRTYLNYELGNHFGEIGTLVWLTLTGASVVFVWLLGIAYLRHARTVTLSGVAMIGGAAASAGTAVVFASSFVTIAITGRGYPGFAQGDERADLMVMTYSWNLTEICFALNTALLGLIWCAVAAAHRRDAAVLPAPLGRAAALVAVIDLTSLVSLFVPTGPWSPGSVLNVLPGAAATYIWIMVAAVILMRRNGLPSRTRAVAAVH
ncbi:hypothetical protein D5S18_27410 [Nocardia panacis]|uniref:DUF998 domain-containing protein n=1 Tax=Nocardia panacis TaxID=2340916 RepID=A0A3A4KBD2_9NOCA|nr:hypothetical protein [Nocardia panacis]RJO70911.1 hypothetical protein D5S18_27410 [Nocardia panacis]